MQSSYSLVEPSAPVVSDDYGAYARAYLRYLGLYRLFHGLAVEQKRIRSKRPGGPFTRKKCVVSTGVDLPSLRALRDSPRCSPGDSGKVLSRPPSLASVQLDEGIDYDGRFDALADGPLEPVAAPAAKIPLVPKPTPVAKPVEVSPPVSMKPAVVPNSFGLTKNNVFEVLIGLGWSAKKFKEEWEKDADLRLCHPDYIRLVCDRDRAGPLWLAMPSHRKTQNNWNKLRMAI